MIPAMIAIDSPATIIAIASGLFKPVGLLSTRGR
jgi:hypothetical protein